MSQPAHTTDPGDDVKALAQAFEVFTRSTQSLEGAYRLLEARAKELSEELAAKIRELALTNDYLNYLLESMSDGVVAVDTQGVITEFNRSAGAILGYAAEEAVGKPFHTLFNRDFSPAPGTASTELRAKNGRSIPVIERDSPIADRTNKQIGSVKVFQDLSEIESLRAQVRQMDRLAAIGEMAATVAHEIRNPLGGIRGFAALLARDIPTEDPRARLVEKILVGVKNLDRVVSELLEYTRPVELHLRSTSCADLVDAALAYVETGLRPVRIVNDADRDLTIRADPDKMRQVLLNILINAVESIEWQGEIHITTIPDAHTVTVAVTDTGCGIPADDLQKVFSPFFTTKERGTGLGLAVAAKIVECHGGRLEATSERGKGSTFLVRLPRTG